MSDLAHLFENNRRWAERRRKQDPEFFARLAAQQTPQYLWIGCSDSRIPANEVTDLDPGEVFVHRNVANLVVNTDLNCLSVIQFAVEFLKVRHVIVCGHYGCAGVRAAMNADSLGLCDHWIRNIRDVRAAHREELDAIGDDCARYDRLVELNVLEQANRVAGTPIVQKAWSEGADLTVHAWVYRLGDGLLHDLARPIGGPADVDATHRLIARP